MLTLVVREELEVLLQQIEWVVELQIELVVELQVELHQKRKVHPWTVAKGLLQLQAARPSAAPEQSAGAAMHLLERLVTLPAGLELQAEGP